MKNNDLFKHMVNDKSFRDNVLEDLQSQLNQEMNKPFHERNFEKIEQLTKFVCEVARIDEDKVEECGMFKIEQEIKHEEKFKKFKPFIILGISIVIIIAVCLFSFFACDVNIISSFANMV